MDERFENMYEHAKAIQDMCGSGLVTEEELKTLSEEFYADFGCHWTEILDKWTDIVKDKSWKLMLLNVKTVEM